MDKVINCLTSDYANFSGRASRSEYWYFILFRILVFVILDFMINIPELKSIFAIITIIFCLSIEIPAIAVLTRRLHDVDKSGWWQLISIIPLIGGLYLFFLCLTPGTIGTNNFGSDPLQNL